MEEGATVSVYVSASLCAEAEAALAAAGGRAGEVRVRAVCLAPARAGTRIDLAATGANARRATEDSSTVAVVGDADPAATRFTRPILAEAGIALVTSQSGRRAMSQILSAIDQADTSSSLRESLYDSLP